MKKDVLEYVRDNTELRATIAHLSAVIEEATELAENLADRLSVPAESFDDLLAILAKATPTLKHSKDLTVGEK